MFLLVGRVGEFKAGVELAREVVFNGKGLAKLREWVRCQNRDPDKGLAKFEKVLREAGV
jgi:anthranilate phosphoribosyltransferase